MTNPSIQLVWRKASFSGANGGDCVEIADTGASLVSEGTRLVVQLRVPRLSDLVCESVVI